MSDTYDVVIAGHEFAAHGIKAQVSLDLKTMLARKDKVVDDLTGGIEFLMKKNKIDYIVGAGGQSPRPGRLRSRRTKRRKKTDSGDEEHHYRHRFGNDAVEGRRYR